VISVVKIQQAFESLVGRKVAKTTIYRMLDRHGRRGVLPRPRLQRATNKPRRAANEGAVSLFFEEVGRRHPDEFVLMVLDGAGWHRARELKVPGNMHLVFLPSYSPGSTRLNTSGGASERIGFETRSFKAWVGAVEDPLVRALGLLENDSQAVASVAGFSWIQKFHIVR